MNDRMKDLKVEALINDKSERAKRISNLHSKFINLSLRASRKEEKKKKQGQMEKEDAKAAEVEEQKSVEVKMFKATKNIKSTGILKIPTKTKDEIDGRPHELVKTEALLTLRNLQK